MPNIKNKNIKTELLLLVSSLYYIEKLSQTKVAKLAGISQANVSRYLNEARERGIVQISVQAFSPQNSKLEEKLKSALKLKNIIVINTIQGQSIDQCKMTVSHFAAPIISNLIKPNTTVCIAAGRHIYNMVGSMNPTLTAPNVSFIQAMGDVSPDIQEDDAIEISRKLALKWKGNFQKLQAPAITQDEETFRAFTSHQQIKSVLNQMNYVDLAIVGIGILFDSVFFDRDFMNASEIESLEFKGISGEICGHFYDENGCETETQYKNRVIGISLKQLKNASEVIAITSGKNRAEAVQAAIKGGIIKSLIIDDIGAKAILAIKD